MAAKKSNVLESGALICFWKQWLRWAKLGTGLGQIHFDSLFSPVQSFHYVHWDFMLALGRAAQKPPVERLGPISTFTCISNWKFSLQISTT